MLSIYNINEPLFETSDKVKNLDKSIERFFPSLWNSISGNLQYIFPIFTRQNLEEEKIFNDRSSGLKADICINNANYPDAYTIPAVSSKLAAQILLITLLPGMIVYCFYGLKRLSEAQLTAKLKDKKVVFSSPNNFRVLMWETKGLKSFIQSDDLRYAIQLHEIGHWVNYKSGFSTLLIKIIGKFIGSLIPILLPPIIIATIVHARSAEWRADKFVKEMGYGKQLSDALEIMGSKRRINVSVLVKLSDIIHNLMSNIYNVLDKYIPITTHPSIEKRRKELQDSNITDIDDYMNMLYETSIIDFTQEKIISLVKPLFSNLDKLLADHVGDIFPLSNR